MARKFCSSAGLKAAPGLELRTLDSGAAVPLAGTEDASAPFWSPDSQSIAFFNQSDNTLRRTDADGRSVRVVTTVPGLGLGGTWNRDGTILFASNPGLFRVSADGGAPTQVTKGPFQIGPQFLPDGRHFLYHVPNPFPAGVYVGQLDGSITARLLDADATPVFVSGHLLFVRQGTLFAQTFDPTRLALSGNPFRVADQISLLIGFPAAVSASTTGTLIFRRGSPGPMFLPRQLVWFDRSGNELGKIGDPEPGPGSVALSPDGRQVILSRRTPPEIGLLALDRAVWTRFTTDAALVHLEPMVPGWHSNRLQCESKGPLRSLRKADTQRGNPAPGVGLAAGRGRAVRIGLVSRWPIHSLLHRSGSEDTRGHLGTAHRTERF